MLKKIVLLIHPRILQLFAVFFLGLVLGGIYINTQYAAKIDTLLLEKQNLENDLEATQEELEEVKKNLSAKNIRTINTIETHVSIKNNNLSKYEKEGLEMELNTQVKHLLEPIKGTDITELNYFLIPQIIDKRNITVEERHFQLETEFVVVSEKTVVQISAFSKKTEEESKEE